MENKNIELVKGLLDKFMAGDGAGYIEGCHEEFYGKVFSGLIPGGVFGAKSMLKCILEDGVIDMSTVGILRQLQRHHQIWLSMCAALLV